MPADVIFEGSKVETAVGKNEERSSIMVLQALSSSHREKNVAVTSSLVTRTVTSWKQGPSVGGIAIVSEKK